MREKEAELKNKFLPTLKSVETQTDEIQVLIKNVADQSEKQKIKAKKMRTTLAGDDDIRIFQQLQEQKMRHKKQNQSLPRSQDRSID